MIVAHPARQPARPGSSPPTAACWRPVAALGAFGVAATAFLSAVQPTLRLQNEAYTIDNPVGITGAPDPENGAFGTALLALLLVCMVAAVASVVLRFRRSRGVERQQLKWFTFAAALLAPSTPGSSWGWGSCSAGSGSARRAGWWPGPPWPWRRCSSRPGGGSRPTVDRRFNRRRYDAARTVEAFSARLRDQIDLDTLSTELLAGVDQTVEPTTVSLWLRPAARP